MDRELLQQARDALFAIQQSAAGMRCGLKICDDTIIALDAALAAAPAQRVAGTIAHVRDGRATSLIATLAAHGLFDAAPAQPPQADERCPACGEGTLTLRYTGSLFLKTCSHCKADLGDDETCRFNRALLAAPQAQPVARVLSWVNGSYSRKYKLEWLRNDVPEGALLYAAPQAQPAAPQEAQDAGGVAPAAVPKHAITGEPVIPGICGMPGCAACEEARKVRAASGVRAVDGGLKNG